MTCPPIRESEYHQLAIGKSHFHSTSNPKPTNYQYPDSYQEFVKKQQDMHKSGVKRAQELINKFLPEDFLTLLESHGVWDLPYSFRSQQV